MPNYPESGIRFFGDPLRKIGSQSGQTRTSWSGFALTSPAATAGTIAVAAGEGADPRAGRPSGGQNSRSAVLRFALTFSEAEDDRQLWNPRTRRSNYAATAAPAVPARSGANADLRLSTSTPTPSAS